jgi:isoleucyl-tRNA synthetase
LEVEGVVLDTKSELEPKLDFSREGEQWEATSKADGSLVVAVDCTQDEAIVSAGRSRELVNGIQQLRKGAGLDLKDVVEVFYKEEEGVSVVEDAVARNVTMFEAKFKGSVPLPQRFAPKWSVVLKSDSVEVGGTTAVVSICRPALAASDSLAESACRVLATLEPKDVSAGKELGFSVNGARATLTEGKDFWVNTANKVRSTKTVDWL